MCDLRAGRTLDQRAEIARGPIAVCAEILGLRNDRLVVEFNRHTGDEMYRTEGRWSIDRAETEGHRPAV